MSDEINFDFESDFGLGLQRFLPELLATAGAAPDWSALREAAGPYLQGLAENRAQFQVEVERLPQHVREAVQPRVTSVHKELDQARRIADLAMRAIDDCDAARLPVLGNTLENAARSLEVALNNFGHHALVALGPSPLPGVNRICQALEISQGLEGVLGGEATALRRQIAAAGSDPALCDSFKNLLTVVDDLLFNKAENARERLMSAAVAVHEAQYNALLKRASSSQRVGELLLLAEAVRVGQAEPSLLLDEARALLREVRTLLPEVAVAARAPEADQPRAAAALLQRMDDALLQLCHAAESGQLENIPAILPDLRDAAEGLMATQQAFEQAGKVLCVRCGLANPSNRRTCQQCSALLPAYHQMDQSDGLMEQDGEAADGVRMTENLQRLLDAVQNYANGTLPPEGFESELTWMEDLVATARQQAPPSQKPDDPAVVYTRGIDRMEEALFHFRHALNTGVIEALDSGSTLLWDGAKDVQEAQRQAQV